MLRFADLLEKHNDELAALETWDNGKPYEQAAKIELPMIVRVIRYYAGIVSTSHAFLAIITLFMIIPLTFYLKIPQVGPIRFTVSQFQLMGSIITKPCMSQLELQVR